MLSDVVRLEQLRPGDICSTLPHSSRAWFIVCTERAAEGGIKLWVMTLGQCDLHPVVGYHAEHVMRYNVWDDGRGG